MAKIKSIKGLEEYRRKLLTSVDLKQPRVSVCGGANCLALGAAELAGTFEAELKKKGLKGKVALKTTGCHGLCGKGPRVLLRPQEIAYQQVRLQDVPEIVGETLAKGKVLEHLLFKADGGDPVAQKAKIPFYQGQHSLVTSHLDAIDPESLDDYLAVGGYEALAQVLGKMTPDAVIKAVEASGLRGRAGGGFPTGRKWRSTREMEGEVKFLICNANEGDPGTFVDRALLEGDPHAVLEGMIIGGYAIGARRGYIYVRHEYRQAVARLTLALDQARKFGLLGEKILGNDFSFDIKLSRGAGAFVCGEETALIASVEGRIGEPMPRPPYPFQKGLWGMPTVINNVETWANVPAIIRETPKKYASLGTEASKGTKLFSLAGALNCPGLVEVPLGITLKQVIFGIGGGMVPGREFKAAQTGSPSGGIIPPQFLDLPLDFDKLHAAGFVMGSGGVTVMDQTHCMVDVARYLMAFLHRESCGKCTPCREGTRHMLDILNDIATGEGREEQLEWLEELAGAMQGASICGLGQSAPDPVLTTLKYFKDEYLAHIRNKKCPALVCRVLLKYTIDPETCTGCMACVRECPTGAISGERQEPQELDDELCVKCGFCYDVCKFDSVKVKS
jgi:NADH-quinone oxidoreductase subunit F